MMNQLSPCILIKPKKLEIISNYLCDQEELIYASKTQFNFPPSRNLPAQEGYIILTYGFIYLFTKENKELKFQEQFCLFNCQEIKFIDEKGKNLKSAILLKKDSEENTFTFFNAKKIEICYEYIYYSLNIISNGLKTFFTLPKLGPPIPMKCFPVQFCLFKRSLYLIHSDMKQQKIPKTTLEGANYLKDPNIFFKGQLLIGSNFHPGNFSNYYGKAIGIDPHLIVIVFKDFKEEFVEFWESILINAKKIFQIKFTDYENSAPVFNFEKVKKTSIEKFQFVNSNFTLIENFMNGIINYSCDIKHIKFASIPFHQEDLIHIFDHLNKVKCFANLTSFSLFDMKFGQFPFEVFSQFLQQHSKIESLTFSNIDVDGSVLLREICKTKTDVYQLHLNHLNFDEQLNFADKENPVSLPRNIVLLDFSYSKFKNLTFQPILEFITSSDVNISNLMTNFSHLEPKGNTFIKAFNGLDMLACQPNIGDFDWSGNALSNGLFNFLSTQNKLQYLELNELTIEKPKSFFQALLKFMKAQNLIGLEISSEAFNPESVNSFLDSCKELQNIQHLSFRCQPEQNEIGVKIGELIYALKNLKEVTVNMKKLSSEAFFKITNSIAYNSSILACSIMNCDVDPKDPKMMEINLVLRKIHFLKVPSTMEQRASSSICNRKSAKSNLSFTFEAKVEPKE